MTYYYVVATLYLLSHIRGNRYGSEGQPGLIFTQAEGDNGGEELIAGCDVTIMADRRYFRFQKLGLDITLLSLSKLVSYNTIS